MFYICSKNAIDVSRMIYPTWMLTKLVLGLHNASACVYHRVDHQLELEQCVGK